MMSFRLTQAAIDCAARFGKSERAVLIVLCRYSDDRTGECHPSRRQIAERSELNVRTVIEAVKNLEAAGWISTRIVTGKGRSFRINIDRILSSAEHESALVQKTARVHESTLVQKDAHVQEVAKEGCDFLHGGSADLCTGVVQEPAPKEINGKITEEIIEEDAVLRECDIPTGWQFAGWTEDGVVLSRQPGCIVSDTATVGADAPADARGWQRDFRQSATPSTLQRVRLPHDELPEKWRRVCEERRPDLDADLLWLKFQAEYGQEGAKGRTELYAGEWLKRWLNWVAKEKAPDTRSNAQPVREEAWDKKIMRLSGIDVWAYDTGNRDQSVAQAEEKRLLADLEAAGLDVDGNPIDVKNDHKND